MSVGLESADTLESPRRLKWYAAGAAAGVGVAAAVLVYAFTAFAAAEDVKDHGKRIGALEVGQSRIEEQRTSDLEFRTRLEEDYHTNREQMWEIAKAVGARVLPAPHK